MAAAAISLVVGSSVQITGGPVKQHGLVAKVLRADKEHCQLELPDGRKVWRGVHELGAAPESAQRGDFADVEGAGCTVFIAGSLGEDVVPLDVAADATVADVLRRVGRGALLYAGRELPDSETLADAGVGSQVTLTFVPKRAPCAALDHFCEPAEGVPAGLAATAERLRDGLVTGYTPYVGCFTFDWQRSERRKRKYQCIRVDLCEDGSFFGSIRSHTSTVVPEYRGIWVADPAKTGCRGARGPDPPPPSGHRGVPAAGG
eukprot:TRINITY_DN12655_c0_g1_i1.p1 TRINITY_DN12655_c0_g1~~TRINITY_DN12655_c0_g1_i1.p1  ORF type:complete len:283 (+),score=41.70 TRINITY_DN12655_c0_g1_i1:70-849(+)